MRGPKPKPTALKRLNGNPGKRPLNLDEPRYPMDPEAFAVVPEELVGRTAAATEWRRLSLLLTTAGTLTTGDRLSLLALCLTWDAFCEAHRHLAAEGPIVSAPSGYPMVSPWSSIAHKNLVACMRLFAELGLTPSSRSRVHAVVPARDAFAEFDTPFEEAAYR